MTTFQFHSTCVDWSRRDCDAGGGLHDMIDASVNITRRTMLRAVGAKQLHEIEAKLGYSNHPKRGLTMAGDYHVSYLSLEAVGAALLLLQVERHRAYFYPGSEAMIAIPIIAGAVYRVRGMGIDVNVLAPHPCDAIMLILEGDK
jgi:hypothetical protein